MSRIIICVLALQAVVVSGLRPSQRRRSAGVERGLPDYNRQLVIAFETFLSSCLPSTVIHHRFGAIATATTFDGELVFGNTNFMHPCLHLHARNGNLVTAPRGFDIHLNRFLNSSGISIHNCGELLSLATPYLNINLSNGTLVLYPIDFFHYNETTNHCSPRYAVSGTGSDELLINPEAIPGIEHLLHRGDRFFCKSRV